MSITRETRWVIYCARFWEQSPRCHRAIEVARGWQTPETGAVREFASREGWTVEDGDDLCPFHAAVAFAEGAIHAGEL